jgi:cysteine-rich repeat protein
MSRHVGACLLGFLATLLLTARPAHASFHLIKIVEVFSGTPASPAAQYVVLQMFATGENFVGSHAIKVYDKDNVLINTFTFASNLPNGANQTKILIATPQAVAFFGLAADLTMTAILPPAGGKVCYDTIDCVAWGNYAPSDASVGTPFNAATGIPPGKAMVRRLDVSGSPTLLESTDDTNNCANDFLLGTPSPRNNAGVVGTVPPATCGNGVIEGLEECDDHNTDSGDGCSSSCTSEALVGVGPLDPGGLTAVRAMPNPFRGNVSLQFTLARPGLVDITVFDLAGRRVRSLQTSMAAGPQSVAWDGMSDAGRRATAGFYTLRVHAGTETATIRLVRVP